MPLVNSADCKALHLSWPSSEQSPVSSACFYAHLALPNPETRIGHTFGVGSVLGSVLIFGFVWLAVPGSLSVHWWRGMLKKMLSLRAVDQSIEVTKADPSVLHLRLLEWEPKGSLRLRLWLRLPLVSLLAGLWQVWLGLVLRVSCVRLLKLLP